METRAPAAPVLLVMGLGMPGHLWGPVRDALAARGVAVDTCDHRGVGTRASEPPRADMAGLAADVADALDARGWPVAHLVGISMGGMVAQELAVRRPDRLRSLTLVATAAWGRALAWPTREAMAAFLGERDRARRLGRLLFPPEIRDDPAFWARAERMAAEMAPPSTVRAHLRAVWGHDARNRLGTLRVPTLVVRPARDVLIPPVHPTDLAARIPGARLETFEAAGHGLIAQVPDALAAVIVDHALRAEAPR